MQLSDGILYEGRVIRKIEYEMVKVKVGHFDFAKATHLHQKITLTTLTMTTLTNPDLKIRYHNKLSKPYRMVIGDRGELDFFLSRYT